MLWKTLSSTLTQMRIIKKAKVSLLAKAINVWFLFFSSPFFSVILIKANDCVWSCVFVYEYWNLRYLHFFSFIILSYFFFRFIFFYPAFWNMPSVALGGLWLYRAFFPFVYKFIERWQWKRIFNAMIQIFYCYVDIMMLE